MAKSAAKISTGLRKRLETILADADPAREPIPVLVRFAGRRGAVTDLQELNERLLAGRGRLLPLAGVVAVSLSRQELSHLSECVEVSQVLADENLHPCKDTASS